MRGNSWIILPLFIFCTCLSFEVQAQKTKAQLQREREQNLRKIKEAEQILKQTTSQKSNTLGQLNALNEQIRAQEQVINNIKEEINLIDGEIEENSLIIESLEQDLEQLKKEYAAMIYAAYKSRSGQDPLIFIFSAKSFNQVIMRIKYLEQYTEARTQQVDEIIKVQEILQQQVSLIKETRQEKTVLLGEQMTQNKILTGFRQDQGRVLSSLSKQEKQLKSDLEATKKAVAEIDRMIDAIIKEEMARAEREAKAKEGKTVSAEAVKLSANFAENKSKFQWPVSGFISQKYGRQNHPILKGIIIENEGINIQTRQNEAVKVVFDGEVRKIAFVPLLGNMVMVKHGEYFTIYIGLSEVHVSAGQQVKTGQNLGTMGINKDGVSELKFQVRKNTQTLDPMLWLLRQS